MTTVDSNAVEACILQEVTLYFGKRYGKDLAALILSGSLARSEATVVESDGMHRVMGDAEFLLIFRESARLLPDDNELKSDCSRIEAILQERHVSCVIGANRAYPTYLQRMRPHIFGYELRACGRVLLGDIGILSLIPPFTANEIPNEEAWQLLMNRLIELIKPALEVECGPGLLTPELQYRTAKLYLDMASSLLLCKGAFVAGYRERCARLAEIAQTTAGLPELRTGASEQWPFPLTRFAQRVAEATEFKLSGRPASSTRTWQYFVEALGYARQLWKWELLKLTGLSDPGSRTDADAADDRLMDEWTRSEPLSRRVRGWLSELRRTPEPLFSFVRSYWLARGWGRSPRYCVYQVAAELVFRLPILLEGEGPGFDYQAMARRLPRQIADTGVAEPWKQLGRAILRNYDEILIGTRS